MLELGFISTAQAADGAVSAAPAQPGLFGFLLLILIIAIVIIAIKKLKQNNSKKISAQLTCETCMIFYGDTEKFCKKCGQKLMPIKNL